MDLQKLLKGLESRQSFSMIASALKQRDLDVVSVGWPMTAQRIEALAAVPTTLNLTNNLFEIYMENVLFTQKALLLWPIAKDIAEKICEKMPEFVDVNSPYLSEYPFSLSPEMLEDVTALGVPTGVYKDGEASTLLFASKREKTEEELLTADKIPKEWLAAGYTLFYGKKRHVFQVFDSITVDPTRGFVEMRIDYGKGLSERDIVNYRNALSTRFNKLVKESLGIEQLLGQAVNLAPALEPLYKGKSWTVYHINHQNDGGFANSNKGRYRCDDVRGDTYHKNGEEAVGTIQLWQVNAAFKSSHRAMCPLLILEGNSSMLSSLVPFMDIARIIDCATASEYRTVFDALVKCLLVEVDTETEELHEAEAATA